MNKTGIPYLDFCWNPCGFGCSNSNNCPTCWAYRQATGGGPTAPACPGCRAFKVHFHPERMDGKLAPASRKRSAVIGVQFLGDLWDRQRPLEQTLHILDVINEAHWHTFIFLTQQPERMRACLDQWLAQVAARGRRLPRNWHLGTTCKSQDGYRRAAAALADTNWNWWVSAEPLWAPITPSTIGGNGKRPLGIVLGADNRVKAPFNMEWHRQTAAAFAAAGVKVHVKQLWLLHCPQCGTYTESEPPAGGCDCTNPDWRRVLVDDDPSLFPDDLASRELPWTLTMGDKP